MKEQIPVNPVMLTWARETAGISIEEVSRRIKKPIEVIQSWESGADTPTYIQLEKLAYQIYKRPLALFFFPDPPQEETPEQSFRTLPDQEIENMSSRMKILIRRARVLQENLRELNEAVNPADRHIFKELQINVDQSLGEMVTSVREFIGIDLDQQFGWKDSDQAFKRWRESLEENGIFVFKDAFKEDAFSGFCLYDNEFPIIYINNSKSNTRQIFTLFHELAHILFKTGGVDARIDDYINYLGGDDRKIEIICNRFAGAYLVPDSDFNERIKGTNVNDILLNDLASLYKVSREVILRKFLDRNIVDQNYYLEKTEEWANSKKTKKGGGNYYRNIGIYLSQSYMEQAFSRFYQNRISDVQLASYLGIKTNGITNVESIMMSKGIFE